MPQRPYHKYRSSNLNMGLFPLSGMAIAWTLAEGIGATLVGAWLYKEEAAAVA